MIKSEFFKNLKVGAIIEVTLIEWDGKVTHGKYFYTGKSIEKINGPWSEILIDDIDDELNIFTYDYSNAFVTKISIPSDFKEIYTSERVVQMSKKEIEEALGFKIEIVEE